MKKHKQKRSVNTLVFCNILSDNNENRRQKGKIQEKPLPIALLPS